MDKTTLVNRTAKFIGMIDAIDQGSLGETPDLDEVERSARQLDSRIADLVASARKTLGDARQLAEEQLAGYKRYIKVTLTCERGHEEEARAIIRNTPLEGLSWTGGSAWDFCEGCGAMNTWDETLQGFVGPDSTKEGYIDSGRSTKSVEAGVAEVKHKYNAGEIETETRE